MLACTAWWIKILGQVATTGIKLDGAAPAVETPPPELGQHNAEIWQELGLSTEDIDTLQEDGAI